MKFSQLFIPTFFATLLFIGTSIQKTEAIGDENLEGPMRILNPVNFETLANVKVDWKAQHDDTRHSDAVGVHTLHVSLPFKMTREGILVPLPGGIKSTIEHRIGPELHQHASQVQEKVVEALANDPGVATLFNFSSIGNLIKTGLTTAVNIGKKVVGEVPNLIKSGVNLVKKLASNSDVQVAAAGAAIGVAGSVISTGVEVGGSMLKPSQDQPSDQSQQPESD